MKRFIINMLERIRVKKSKPDTVDVALAVENSASVDASFSDDTPTETIENKTGDVELSLPRSCMNCGEVLTGPYCFSCGQKEGDIRRPIWSLLSELFDNIVAPDSKLFKTLLLLLFVPGKLTNDYNTGRRARFIPPLRLYITITFAFFALLLVADVLILDINFTKKTGNVAPVERSELIKDAIEASQGLDEQGLEKQKVENNQELEDGQGSGERVPPPPLTANVPADVGAENDNPSLDKNTENLASGTLEGDDAENISAPAGIIVETGGAKRDLSPTLEKLKERFGDSLLLDTDDLSDEERLELSILMDEELKSIPAVARGAVIDQIVNGNGKIDVGRILEGNLEESAIQVNGRGINIGSDGFPYNVSFGMFVKRSDEKRESIDATEIRQWITDDGDNSEEIENLANNFAEAMQDPRKFNELFNDWLPQTLFVMVPFFALILRLFHWGKKRFYFNQLIFSLHFHSFLFLIFIGFIFIIPVTGAELAGPIFWGISSLYMIIALKYGQDQGWIKAFLKAGFIWVSYAVILTSTLFAAVMFGLSGGSFGDLIGAVF